jgi:tetratricopeptide (TPR) repeat protein
MQETGHSERRNEYVRTFVALAVWIICFVIKGYAQVIADPIHHSLILKGIYFTLEQKYDSAETIFTTVINEYPQHPSGYLYLAGLLQARYTDYDDYFDDDKYDSLLTAAEELSEPLINRSATKAWGYLYTGMAEAFRSFTASEKGSLPKGFFYGISAAKSMEKCLEVDSTFSEAKDILGAYYYWSSKLAWIPFVNDRSEEGISMILETLNHPYERHLAVQNLMLIFIDEKKYSEAEKYGAIMLAQYPDNRSFLWNMMTAYEQSGDSVHTKEISKRLLESAMNAPVVNRYTEATCRLKLAQYALRDGEKEAAKNECQKIILLKRFVGTTKGDLKKKIKTAEDILSTLQ